MDIQIQVDPVGITYSGVLQKAPAGDHFLSVVVIGGSSHQFSYSSLSRVVAFEYCESCHNTAIVVSVLR